MDIKKYKNLIVPGVITTPFNGKTRGEAVHPGVDFANKSGTPIKSFADGVVTGVKKDTNGFGNVVLIKDIGGNVHQYGHLQRAVVKPGTKVKKGQQIANMGKSGNSYSPSGGDPSHLDLRIASPDGKWKNPMSYINNK